MGSEILTQVQLKRLKDHKYNVSGTSLMEPLLQPFWRWVVEQIPRTWAPNAITMTGLMANISCILILTYYSPDAETEAPRWTFLLCALGLFLYQTMDAIDGKQARRTGTNSPLGELFDHGCDSVSTLFVMMGCSMALGMGSYPAVMMFLIFVAMFLYYSAHWQAYVSGELKFAIIDVTEGQLIIITVHLMSAVVGQSFWATEVPYLGVQLKLIPITLGLLATLKQLHMNCKIIFIDGGPGKDGSTIAGSSTIFPIIPIVTIFIIGWMIAEKSTSSVYEMHPMLYLLTFGIVACKITNTLVVAHMTKSEMYFWDTIFIGPAMLLLNQYLNCVLSEYVVLWICCLYCTYDFVMHSWNMCVQICQYFNIYCFTITSKPRNTSSSTMRFTNGM